MAYYRLYHLHGPNYEVESFHEFDAENDDAAIAMGETWRAINPMELWQGHRKVHWWDGLAQERVGEK